MIDQQGSCSSPRGAVMAGAGVTRIRRKSSTESITPKEEWRDHGNIEDDVPEAAQEES